MGSCHDWEDTFEAREAWNKDYAEFKETEVWKAAYKQELKTALGRKLLARTKVRDAFQKQIEKLEKQIDKIRGKMWNPKKDCNQLNAQFEKRVREKVGYKELD
jgi:peptidoglycan hydrolase CwlO-like protein